MDKLAINGGEPVRTKVWSSWPHFAEDEIQAVSEVLRSGKVNYWTGEIHTLPDNTKVRGECGLFEYDFSCHIGVNYAVALANGSLALELALHSLGIGNGDEVIVTSRTFIASASACVMRGAVPVFADIDRDSQNITVETIKAVMTKKTKAVICVHLAGWACEMDEIMEFAKQNKLKVIEDCAQCVGGKYKNKMLGSIGDMAAFSFCQDKIMTTGGEGGMLTCNDPDLYKKAWTYKDHGKDFNKYNKDLQHLLVDNTTNDNESYYTSLGTNWRMTEMQAAIGRIQLQKLPEFIKLRRKYANMLNCSFKDVYGLRTVIPPSHIFHAYYKYYISIEADKLCSGWNRNRVIDAINAEGVDCQFGSTWGVGLESAWRNIKCTITGNQYNYQLKKHFPNDYIVGSTILMFQVHPALNIDDIGDTVAAVRKVMRQATNH